ncbi:MAG: right-handed parallel beta-helix repeat-containing protein, partial [Proteobacteria bacterium]|nr:right-handed parallel beta-helix repeat-containing protein [Pseudomonadota bacterium]
MKFFHKKFYIIEIMFLMLSCLVSVCFIDETNATDSGLYFNPNGGYGRIRHSDFFDLDYSRDFSVEVVVNAGEYENRNVTWPGILGKSDSDGLYNQKRPGWALGLYASRGTTYVARISDGTNSVSVTAEHIGITHLLVVWEKKSKTLTLYLNGVITKTRSNKNINPTLIASENDFQIAKSLGRLQSPILYARLWNKDLSTSAKKLFNHFSKTKQHGLPHDFDRTGLISEWLMFETCDKLGRINSTHAKDTVGANHIEFVDGASIVKADGLLSPESPKDGSVEQNKSLWLRATGGYSNLSALGTVKGPVQYFFQVDTEDSFGSSNLKESGWIANFQAWQPKLKPNTRYYWRVKTRDSQNDYLMSEYSNVSSLKTEGATNWYVRPKGVGYGKGNGTTYENAWNGLESVIWGKNGVEAGDTLFVCGTHVKFSTGWEGAEQGQITIQNSGFSNDQRITIRGDYKEEFGVVWGGNRINYENWVDEGDNVWSSKIIGQHDKLWWFQDIAIPNPKSYTPLESMQSVQALKKHIGGAVYWNSSQNTVFVKTTDLTHPHHRIFSPNYGYRFQVIGKEYISFENIDFFIHPVSLRDTSHIRWENCTFYFAGSRMFSFWDNAHHMEILNSEIAWCGNGIYTISSSSTSAPSSYRFAGNYIHDIGVGLNANSDAHAIGIQGGHNGIIEDNLCVNSGHPILLYAFTNQTITNNIVRRNTVIDGHTAGSQSSYGISTQCNNDSSSDKTGNQFYQNIVINVPIAYRFQFEDGHEVYNNLAYNSRIGLYTGRNFINNDGTHLGPKITAVNNIFNTTEKHIMMGSGARKGYEFHSDYNLFDPANGSRYHFTWHNLKGVDFKSWQAAQGKNKHATFDPHSKEDVV